MNLATSRTVHARRFRSALSPNWFCAGCWLAGLLPAGLLRAGLLCAGLLSAGLLCTGLPLGPASACEPRNLHVNRTPAEIVVTGHVLVPQYNEQHDQEPVWVTQSYMHLQVESCTPIAGEECLGRGEHKLRHNGRQQFLEGERVALVLFRRPDTGQYQILYRFTLSDQNGDGQDEVYSWSRGDLLRHPQPTAENHYWADNLQWNYRVGEEPPGVVFWEDVLFKAFRDAPPLIRAAEGLPRKVHADLDRLIEWLLERNLELAP